MHRRAPRHPTLLALALAALVAATGLLACKKRPSPAAVPPVDTGPPAWAQVERGIDAQGTFSRDAALAAFAQSVAPLPGVSVPPRDDSVPSCGTPAVAEVYRHFGSLTEAQRAAVRGALQPSRPSSATKNELVFRLPEDAARRAFEEAQRKVSALLGPLRRRVVVGTTPSRPEPPRPPDAGPVRQDGRIAATAFFWCNRPGVRETDPLSPAEHMTEHEAPADADLSGCDHLVLVTVPYGTPELEEVLAHELVHLYQAERFTGRRSGWYPNGTGWAIEGYPTWLGAKLYPHGYEQRALSRYVQGDASGRFALLASPYLASGLFAHLESRGVEVLRRGLDLVNIPDGMAAFTGFVAGSDDAMSQWASSTTKSPERGPAWDLGYAIDARPRVRGVLVVPQAVRAGAPAVVTSAPAATQLTAQEAIAADVEVLELEVEGKGRLRLGETELVWLRPSTVAYCRRAGGCPCPEGGCAPMPSITTDQIFMSFSGSPGRGAVSAAGFTLAEYRRRRPACGEGRYHVDAESAKAAAAARLAPHGYRVTAVTGAMRLTIDRAGPCREEVQRFGFEVQSADPRAPAAMTTRATLDGAHAGTCRVTPTEIHYAGPPVALRAESSVQIGGRWMNVPAAQGLLEGLQVGLSPTAATRYRCQGRDLIQIGPDQKETRWIRDP